MMLKRRVDPSSPAAFGEPPQRRHRRHYRILRGTAALPAFFTILNGLAGLGSIHFATKDGLGKATLTNLSIAAWLILVAMVCDMLDGRLARFTRKTSEFGAQLDSLCDIISFGVAPAMLMLRTVVTALRDQVEHVQFLPDVPLLERLIWCIAAVYVACGALRLARFNVENEPDESGHLTFKGLPIPGAAAMIMSLVLLFAHLAAREKGWQSAPWLLAVVGLTLPVLTLVMALLMVSNFTYIHIVNYYIRGKKPFSYLVKLTVIVVAGVLEPFVTGGAVMFAYVLSGPVRYVWHKIRPRSQTPAPDLPA